MMLAVKNRGFLPKRSVHIKRNDVAPPVVERFLHHVGDPWADGMPFRWLLIREGSELQLHGAFEIAETSGLCRRIMKQEDRRIARLVDGELEPAPLSGYQEPRRRSSPAPVEVDPSRPPRTRLRPSSSTSRPASTGRGGVARPRKAGDTERSMSSEKRSMTANTFDRDVPPLNTRTSPNLDRRGRRGPSSPRSLFRASPPAHCAGLLPARCRAGARPKAAPGTSGATAHPLASSRRIGCIQEGASLMSSASSCRFCAGSVRLRCAIRSGVSALCPGA